jgi:hypothetical protein
MVPILAICIQPAHSTSNADYRQMNISKIIPMFESSTEGGFPAMPIIDASG